MILIPKFVMYISPICQIWLEDMMFVANNFLEQRVFSVSKHG